MTATKNKARTKKKALKKKSPVRKHSSQPKSASKNTRKQTTNKSSSFRIARERTPFAVFRITAQTLYWIILCSFILFFGAWLMQIQADIQRIYDNIEISNSATSYIQYLEQ